MSIKHFEDYCLLPDHVVAKNLIHLKQQIQYQALVGFEHQEFIKTKIDGSPAFVFGAINGNRFISTKGFFNKTPIYYNSPDEILAGNLSGNLKAILLELWDVIDWSLVHDGVMYQGDWIRSASDDSEWSQANVIQYNTPLIGRTYIAIHTMYWEESRGDLVERRVVTIPNVFKDHRVRLVPIRPVVLDDDQSILQIVPDLNILIEHVEYFGLDYSNEFYLVLKKFLNWGVMNPWGPSLDSMDTAWEVFKSQSAQAARDRVKQDASKEHWTQVWDGYDEEYHNNKLGIYEILESSLTVKEYIFDKILPNPAARTSRITFEGRTWNDFEGYVLYLGDEKVKIINRPVFSRINQDPNFKAPFR